MKNKQFLIFIILLNYYEGLASYFPHPMNELGVQFKADTETVPKKIQINF